MKSEVRLNLDQINAGLDGGRRAYKKLSLPLRANGTHFDLRDEGLHRHEDDNGCCNCQWGRGVQDNADGAVVGIGVYRVNVRHLDEREQGEQRQAHQHHDVSCRPTAPGAARPCIECGQNRASWQESPTSRIHILGCLRVVDVTTQVRRW